MSTKHTPGPWFSIDNTSFYKGKRTGTFDIRTCPDHSAGLWIGDAKPYGENRFPDFEAGKANAQLMAAAPDMLSALKAIQGAEAFISDPHVRSLWRLHIYPAITKATGIEL